MFEKIIGNEVIKNTLKNSIQTKTISHSYLMLGISGIGKKMIAFEFAKAILCSGDTKSCNKCKSCIEFDSNNNPDFSFIESEGNSIKIDKIRKLQKEIQEKPIISEKKVYIIDNADLMTKEAQNCLLKTLEEPPDFAVIILIGTNENDFLTTIKSRCMILHFNSIPNKELKRYLEKEYDLENISTNMLDVFQGSIGKAIALKDKNEIYGKVEDIIELLDKADLIDVLKTSEILYKAKDEIFEILDYINIILLKKSINNYLYTNCIKIVENTKKRIKQNSNYEMSIDYLLFNMWEEIN